MRRFFWGQLVLCALSTALTASAQERPSEADMFGGAPQEPAAEPKGEPPAQGAPPVSGAEAPSPNTGTKPEGADAASPTPAAPSGEASRDAQALGENRSPMFTEEAAPEDPLRMGGQIYMRAQTTAAQGQVPGNWTLNAPMLLDVYLDARPNDRLRGYVLTRTSFDPTLPSAGSTEPALGTAQASGGTSGTQSLSSLFQQPSRGPNFALDQLWLRFDIKHTVFVTAGKQHVRWGTGRFWAPTDYLHLRRRNPLDVFDARTGTTMVKLHVPVESKAWNFYAFGLLEDTVSTPKLGRAAVAARAELVFGPTELGLGMMLQHKRKPKWGIDFSAGIGDFDLYGELGLRSGSELDRVTYNPDATIPPPEPPPSYQTPEQTAQIQFARAIDAYYPVSQWKGLRPQVVGGLTYARKYNDNDTFTVGAEYFYNSIGYDSPRHYPGLVLPHSTALNDPATFFYLGRHYGALFVTFPAPFSFNNHTFTLSTLGNFSDMSFITRFDYAFIALTHMRFEAFASARYGSENGEFRFGVNNLNIGGISFSRAAAVADFGLAFRASI